MSTFYEDLKKSLEEAGKMTNTIPFDAAEYLDTPEAQTEFLREALSSGDADYIELSVGVVARSIGRDDTPTLKTLVGVTKALGLKLSIEAA